MEMQTTRKTLLVTLSEGLQARVNATDDPQFSGSTIASTSEGGGSSSFQRLNEQTPEYTKRLFGELIDLFESVLATSGLSLDGSDDTAIGEAMKVELKRTPTSTRNDFTGLRYGAGIYLGQ